MYFVGKKIKIFLSEVTDMKTRYLFLVFIIFAGIGLASAQTKSLTNADLESYRQDRLKAEQDYLENYESLGLPSPAEIERRSEQLAKELAELSDKLRAEGLELERIALQRAEASRKVSHYSLPVIVGVNDNLIYNYYRRNRGNQWMPRRHQHVQPGYFAGGQFWPTGSATPSRPLMAPSRH